MFQFSDLGPLSQYIITKLNGYLTSVGISYEYINISRTVILMLGISFLSLIIWWASRKVLITIVHTIAGKSKTKWDDFLVEKRFFAALAQLVPLVFMDSFIKVVFLNYQKLAIFLLKTVDIIIIFVILIALLRFLSTFEKILSQRERLKDKPIQSYFQLGKIIVSGPDVRQQKLH